MGIFLKPGSQYDAKWCYTDIDSIRVYICV